MTPRQKKVLDFIRSHWASHSYAPTYTEIAAAAGFKSKSNVNRTLRLLERDGHLFVAKGRARGVYLEPQQSPDWRVISFLRLNDADKARALQLLEDEKRIAA